MCAPTELFKALAANGNYTRAFLRASAISGYASCHCSGEATESVGTIGRAASPEAVCRLDECTRLQISVDRRSYARFYL